MFDEYNMYFRRGDKKWESPYPSLPSYHVRLTHNIIISRGYNMPVFIIIIIIYPSGCVRATVLLLVELTDVYTHNYTQVGGGILLCVIQTNDTIYIQVCCIIYYIILQYAAMHYYYCCYYRYILYYYRWPVDFCHCEFSRHCSQRARHIRIDGQRSYYCIYIYSEGTPNPENV